jgi:hypothetical protein
MRDSKHAGIPLYVTVGIFALAWLILCWPWLSGAVTIPWDAKSQFLPQVRFLAAALARGESPFWTPNVFAGWPQIADPQSLILSPLHFLLAWLSAAPSFRAIDAVTFVHLALGGLGIILYFRDRGWHPAGALVAAIAFAFGGAASSRLQHTGQVISLSYLPLALWLIARALEKSSWRAGALAGLIGGLMASGRDQVALIALYVLAGFVVWHWFDGEKPIARVRASVRPLVAATVIGIAVAAVPVTMSALLAAQSNRPEFGFMAAGRGSLHPAHFLMLAFPDLFGASDPAVDYWGPPSLPWSNAFGWPGLYLAQNMGQIYSGALVLVVLAFGIIRGLAWSREIRFFTVATLIVLLYALGWYTPAFHLMYEVLPGVTLYRRTADAAFVFGGLLAIVAGYLVHRWLTGTPPPKRWQRGLELAVAAIVIALAFTLAHTVGRLGVAIIPISAGIAFAGAAIGALALARHLAGRGSIAAALVLAGFTTADLAWNNAPNESTGLKPDFYEALRPDTRDETVALIKAHLAATAAPDRRDRVELTGIAYHWPNLALVHGFEHVFGHNPLRLEWFFAATRVGDTVAGAEQRRFSPLFPSYRSPMADLLGLRVIATGVPVGEIDSSLRPEDLDLIDRTKDAYVYENRRALPRVMVPSDWRRADFDELVATGWPDVDPRRTVLLEHAPAGLAGLAPAPSAAPVNAARIVRYANTDVIIEVDAPAGGILVLNDVWHPWWRAKIDGVAGDILKANVIFRAVVVPPGKHMVRFTFHPFAGAFRDIGEKMRNAR